jgi:pilus assembly protein CpaB
MRLGTIISIGASAVLGIGALLIARLWIPSHAPHAAAAQAAPVVVETSIVVAAKPIPWGTKLDGQFLKVIQMPAADVPQGAYSSVGQILNQDGGPPMALSAMAQQEPVLSSKLTGPGERQSLAALVGPGLRAYTIAVSAATAGGGHILPGDRVDILYSRELPQPPAKADSWSYKLYGTTVLIQSVRVLGMDLNANPTSTQPAVPSTATLEVSMQDAEKLALAIQGGGTLSLALRRPGSAEVESVHRFIIDDPRLAAGYHGNGGEGRPADPAHNGGEAAARAAMQRRVATNGEPHDRDTVAGAQVTVVSGDAATAVHVPTESRGGF